MCQTHSRRQFHHSFLTEEQKAKVLAGNLQALLARFPA